MRVKGLPIGQGELWHDPAQRAATLGLTVLALAPMLAWILPACGVMSPGRFQELVEPPMLGVLAAAATLAALRYRAIAVRAGVGLVVGLVGGLTFELGLELAHLVVPSLLFPLADPTLPHGVGLWGAHVQHWLTSVAAWGLVYALMAGKARWYYGMAWGAIVWIYLALLGLLPAGEIVADGLVGMLALLGIQLAFGAAIGAMNEALQPETRGRGKIIFLRDYVARVKQR